MHVEQIFPCRYTFSPSVNSRQSTQDMRSAVLIDGVALGRRLLSTQTEGVGERCAGPAGEAVIRVGGCRRGRLLPGSRIRLSRVSKRKDLQLLQLGSRCTKEALDDVQDAIALGL